MMVYRVGGSDSSVSTRMKKGIDWNGQCPRTGGLRWPDISLCKKLQGQELSLHFRSSWCEG